MNSPFKSSVFWLSLLVMAASFWIWSERQGRHQLAALEEQKIQTQRATALLFRAFHTDNYLTYAALSKTTARMGDKEMETVARIIHAPRRLSISYQSGDHAGLSGGYIEHWTWRQVAASQPMIPYAELERPNDEMAATRFALLLENYKAQWRKNEPVSGRETALVEIEPLRPTDGARGPGRKLWIDSQTGLTLRQQSFNYQGRLIVESVLSEVDYTPQITSDTFVTPQKLRQAAQTKPWVAHEAGGESRERVAKLAGLLPPNAKNLPPGFRFDSVGANRCTACGAVCYAVLSRYTDGLNTLTIFALKPDCMTIEKTAGKSDAKNGMQSCEFGTGTMVMRQTPQGHLIAVADLPAAALERVLESTTVTAYNSSQR